MSFENQIQHWVSLDNQIKKLNDQIKELRDTRNNLEQNIIQYASSNNLSNSTIQISDGKLKFVNTKQTSPLTLKFVEECLAKCIKSEDQVNQIMTYIKDSREVKYVPDIKRYYAVN